LTGETRLRFWALAGQPPAVVPTNRKQAVPRSRNRGTNYPRSAPPNLVKRNFHAEAPGLLWLTDISEFPADDGKIHFSALVD
ncbi:hypothetical protein ACL1E1_11370, partial [Corynebacterium striatum]